MSDDKRSPCADIAAPNNDPGHSLRDRRTVAEIRCRFGNCPWWLRSTDADDLAFQWLNHSRFHWGLHPLDEDDWERWKAGTVYTAGAHTDGYPAT